MQIEYFGAQQHTNYLLLSIYCCTYIFLYFVLLFCPLRRNIFVYQSSHKFYIKSYLCLGRDGRPNFVRTLSLSLSLYLVVFLTFMFNHIGFLVPALVGLFLFLLIILEMNFLNAIEEVHSWYQLPKKVVRQIDCFQKF